MIATAFIDAVHAFQQGEFAAAADHAQAAAAVEPADTFFRHAATYLGQVAARGTHDMYATPDGFVAFVRGGGNVPLYANLSEQLRSIYTAQQDVTLLDIGVGDGLALLPALTESLSHIDLVEPAAGMLDSTCAALSERGMAHQGFNETVETFIAGERGRYQLAQATFALHNLAPDTRATLFDWLRGHCEQLLIAEFDVQMDVEQGSAEHIDYLASRYRNGLAEYEPDEALVAQGFLMPILFRNFETIGEAAIYEQPIAAWETELRAAGFASVERRLLHQYWWADAYLLVATE